MTLTTLIVLRALLANSAPETYGLEVVNVTGLPSGVVYPILRRFELAGWLSAREEDGDPRLLERPRRRYLQLTPDGAAATRQALLMSRNALALEGL